MVMMLYQRYDIGKFTVDAILYREIQCKKGNISMFWHCFQCVFGWILVDHMF